MLLGIAILGNLMCWYMFYDVFVWNTAPPPELDAHYSHPVLSQYSHDKHFRTIVAPGLMIALLLASMAAFPCWSRSGTHYGVPLESQVDSLPRYSAVRVGWLSQSRGLTIDDIGFGKSKTRLSDTNASRLVISQSG